MIKTYLPYSEEVYKCYAFMDLTWIKRLYDIEYQKLIFAKDYLPHNEHIVFGAFASAVLVQDKPFVFEHEYLCRSMPKSAQSGHALTMILTQAAYEIACLELSVENIVFPNPTIGLERWKQHLESGMLQTKVSYPQVQHLAEMGGFNPFTTDYTFVAVTKYFEQTL